MTAHGDLSQDIMKSQYGLIEDVIFANSFFAIEETGLAYPSLSAAEGDAADEEWTRGSACLRAETAVRKDNISIPNDFKQRHSARRCAGV